ncbi:MAG: TonB-dependent receptor [Bacteroidales bacterium]|jgi:TonB-linked SusC/RagA family outer membrane protein|nr:TonB-dependent receptor [Bacteroidales bacterium]
MKLYKLAIIAVVCSLICLPAAAQTTVRVKGVITDRNNETLPGVNVVVKGATSGGAISDGEGRYEIRTASGATLMFSFVGYATQEITVGAAENQTVNIVMEETAQQLEEVEVVGYGTQRRVSVVGAITSVKPAELKMGSVTSVSNSLAGRVAGLIGIQRSGEPGKDVSEFWIRGISTFGGGSNALVLIDGIDRGASSLNELSPEDIESFSILKDATATAIYGARGGNGVILINTKRGQEGKMTISGDVKTMVETLPRLPKYVRSYDYASLANEASIGRGNGYVYAPAIFDIIKYNMDPDLYPDVNWQDEILKKQTWGVQGNLNISGGGKLARYYMSGFYRTNDAIYRQTGMEHYNSNVRRNQYTFRSNIDVNATKSTVVSLLLSAKIVDMNRPGIGNTQTIWNACAYLTPITVPTKYSNGMNPSYGQGDEASPTVLLNETGFYTDRENTIESLLKVEQDLSMLVKGLKLTGAISFDNYNDHFTGRTKMPALYIAYDRDWNTGELITRQTVEAQNMSYSSSSYGIRTIYAEAKADYNTIIKEKHRVGALFLYQQRDYQRTDQTDELYSIPKRNQGIAGRFTYSYSDIYFIEGNFGYNGSENFPKGQRFGFFPSVALGYVISNYAFVQDRFPFLDMLKLRYSYGLVGNDQILKNNVDVRFPYLTTVNTSAGGYNFGDGRTGGGAGVTDAVLGSTGLVWESAVKQNWGIDLQMWKSVNVTVDAFLDNRNNIFMVRQSLPGTMGVSSDVWGNVGKMRSWGADGTASYTKTFGDWNIEVRGNFTFTRDKIIDYDETPPRYPYLARKGTSNNVTRGLIALGLFKNESDVENSPVQFGDLLPGDIKYQDVNGDGRIDSYDIVPIGNSNIPKIQYGFAGSVMWKNIDFNIFFRGSGKVDYFMGGIGYYPFAGGKTGNVLEMVANQKNRWTPASYSGDPSTENPNARFPRLTYGESSNNNRASTFWLADASFLRLKTVEIGYRLPQRWLGKMAMKNFRLSVVGDNLYVWDKVKLWDPEQASSNGSVYPLTRSCSFVIQFSF